MNKVFSIAGITIRSALRSRVVITLLFLLLLVIVGLPLTVRGDGTLSGHVQILLNYTLGAAGLLLAMVSVWIGCASVSTEIQERQIQLIVTKPVHAFELWMGKWIGILAMNLILVTFAGLVAFGLLLWTTRANVLTDEEKLKLKEEILVARTTLSPQAMDLTKKARTLFEQRRADGKLPPGISPEHAYELIHQTLLVQAYSVPGGTSRQWVFDLPRDPDERHPLFLRFQFSASSGLKVPVKSFWTVGTRTEPDRFRKEEIQSAGGLYSLRIPSSAVKGARQVVVEYGNAEPKLVTVLFSHKDGVQLLLYEGNFLSNYLRALLMLFFQLAFLAAVGLTAGSCFSLPVAAFASCWFILLIHMGHYMSAMAQKTTFFVKHGQPLPDPIFWDHVFRAVYFTLGWMVSPLQTVDTLNLLTAGELISWSVVAGSFVVRILIYSGLMALLSSWVLSRREMALPA